MKPSLIFIFFMTLTLSAFAYNTESERDLKMLKIMKDYRVKSWGKREKQYALITCLIPRKQKVPGKMCKVRVEHTEDPNYTVIYKIYNKEAEIMSALLTEFEVEYWGKRERQDAEIECLYQRKSKLPVKICRVIDESFIWP